MKKREFIVLQLPQTKSEVREKRGIKTRGLDLANVLNWDFDPSYTDILPLMEIEMPCSLLSIQVQEGDFKGTIPLYGTQAEAVKEFFEERWAQAWADLDGSIIHHV